MSQDTPQSHEAGTGGHPVIYSPDNVQSCLLKIQIRSYQSAIQILQGLPTSFRIKANILAMAYKTTDTVFHCFLCSSDFATTPLLIIFATVTVTFMFLELSSLRVFALVAPSGILTL